MEFVYIAIGIAKGMIIAWLILRKRLNIAAAAHREELLKQENAFILEKSELNQSKMRFEERASNLQNEKQELQTSLFQEREKTEKLNRSVSISTTERKNLEEKLESQKQELENLQKRFTIEFENIATKILKENSKEFSSANQKKHE